MSTRHEEISAPAAEKQRLDKWLWFARVVKTRGQAVRLVEEGHVRLNAKRIEAPAKAVSPGDVLTVALERQVRVLRVRALAPRRGSASQSLLLYEDLGG